MSQTKTIYLDYAAATPIDPRVIDSMQPFFADEFYNPSATYRAAGKVRTELESARGRIAHWLGSKSSEIIFTAGGTEANNLAISGVMKRYPESKLVVSAAEHESVSEPAKQFDSREAPVDADGRVKLEKLSSIIDDKTVLVSIMYANNEIGTVQPIREVSQLIALIRKTRLEDGNELPLYLHTDACQAVNYLDLHVARLGVDLMTINGGKIYGPKQSGALFVKTGVQLEPLVYGGGQERDIRSGTENVAGCIGLGTALEIAQTDRHNEFKRMQSLQTTAFKVIEKLLPAAEINGSRKHRLPNNIHVTLPGQDNERLIFALDELGIQVAAGSACSASKEESSHVLHAIGLSDEFARASLRLTMGRSTTENDINRAIEAIAQLTSVK